ncbi:MAG: hypothetical protein ACLGXA_03575 [Acidobacteriota bacterium]
MLDHNPGPDQQDRRGIHAVSHSSGESRPPAGSTPRPPTSPISVPFQLVADFVVEGDRVRQFLQDPDLSPEERSLFLTIINTPEALNRICGVVMVLDLVSDSERYFSKGIFGPQLEITVDAILPSLPGEIQDYWTSMRRVDREGFDFWIDRMFEPFHASLRKTEIRDVTTGESVPFRGQQR